VHTVSRKTERLVNLTIALLATKRYLTKSEIFRTVDGYEGAPESKERMFERDKDDLRNLGIEIEVGSFDPLFEDEAGYRIRPESYQFQLGDVDSKEIALMSLAAEAWRDASMGSSAQSALNKLHAIGIESDTELIAELNPVVINEDENLSASLNAITSRTILAFHYADENLNIFQRVIEPYAIAARFGHWYLFGYDLDRKATRLFRFDRISGSVVGQGKSGAYEIPSGIDIDSAISSQDNLQVATILIRDGRGTNLRNRGVQVADPSIPVGWQRFNIQFNDETSFIEEILWYGDDLVVSDPQNLRSKVLSLLESGVKTYG